MKKPIGLKVNSKIEIDIEDSVYEGKYLTRVMDINDKAIKIMAPSYKGEVVPLRINTPLAVIYIGDKAMYAFYSVILERFKDPIPGFVIKLPKNVERIQRREFVRLEITLKFRYRILDQELITDELDESAEFDKEGYVIDLSAGGVRFYSKEKLEKNASLIIKFDIDEFANDEFLANVVRVKQKELGYEIGVAFESLSPVIQDRIISWIFDKQREFRRKGLA